MPTETELAETKQALKEAQLWFSGARGRCCLVFKIDPHTPIPRLCRELISLPLYTMFKVQWVKMAEKAALDTTHFREWRHFGLDCA